MFAPYVEKRFLHHKIVSVPLTNMHSVLIHVLTVLISKYTSVLVRISLVRIAKHQRETVNHKEIKGDYLVFSKIFGNEAIYTQKVE